jgi:aldehyde dehydrogenase (NAD+)
MKHSPQLARWVQEATANGTLAGLPDGHFIDGQIVPSAAGGSMQSFDPGTARAFASFAAGDAQDVDAAVRAARRATNGPWASATPAERGRVLNRVAALIIENVDRLAVVESLDSGKRLCEALSDVAGAARTFEYYAGACDTQLGTSIPLGPDHIAYTSNEPVGVTAHIVPWNYPLSTAARGFAPALAAGCTVVAKPAEQTPLTTLMLAQLCLRAGIPAGVCNVVTGTGELAGNALVRHPGVDHITFTGSVATGIDVMQAAARHVTRVVLELGGKSPVVVLEDADLACAAENVMGAIFENAGQICSAGSRLVIARRIHERFVDQIAKRAAAMTLGHGLRDADLGPVNSAGHQSRVAGFVDRARERGVQVRTGGSAATDPLTGTGWFYRPTILDSVPPDDEAVQQEIFGPVLCIQIFDDIEEAVALANGTDFGLVAGVFTRDLSMAHRLARRIDAGQVFVNEYFAGGISVPFGGNRRSGFGREKGLEALKSYCKIKSVVVRL